MSSRFLLDTNVIITGFHTYPPDVFPGYWKLLETLRSTGRLLVCKSVYDELKPAGDTASDWVRNTFPSSDILQVTDDTLVWNAAVVQWAFNKSRPKYTLEALWDFADETKADSWLVAHAKEHALTILTNETSSPRKQTVVKIPDAAHSQGIECISMIGLLRSEAVTF